MKHFGFMTLLLAALQFSGWSSEHAHASSAQEGYILDTRQNVQLSVAEFIDSFQGGEYLVFGEKHATQEHPLKAHHQRQARLIRSLRNAITGMEFIEYPYQEDVLAYLGNNLAEAEFLKRIRWSSGNPFAAYREQIRGGHYAVALNAPRELARSVSKGEPLSAEQQRQLPPIWERGADVYFERFLEAMGGHGTPAQMERYFMAQSLWDDTMAWRAKSYGTSFDTFVIIVGEFHAEFGHGLPARLRRHGVDAERVKTLLQVSPTEVRPHPKYGWAADYLWVVADPEVDNAVRLQGKRLHGRSALWFPIDGRATRWFPIE
jgi:uncharacterized iron-regulated protein